MFLVVLCIFVLKLEPAISHFPQHTDLQKVGEVIFNNEKYNILKPTTHIVSDYFEDFVLKRKQANFPTKRLFVDDNAFRHYWSGFNKKTQSLRKTEIIRDDFDVVSEISSAAINNNGSIENTKSSESNVKIFETDKTTTIPDHSSLEITNTMSTFKESTSKEKSADEIISRTPLGNNQANNSDEYVSNDPNSSEVTSTVSILKDDASEDKSSDETISTTPEGDNQASNSNETISNEQNSSEVTSTVSTLKHNASEGKGSDEISMTTEDDDFEVITKKIKTENEEALSSTSAVQLRVGVTTKEPEKERNVVKTTFFCPFFGVITMSAFVD